jgi:hypothetical protein
MFLHKINSRSRFCREIKISHEENPRLIDIRKKITDIPNLFKRIKIQKPSFSRNFMM